MVNVGESMNLLEVDSEHTKDRHNRDQYQRYKELSEPDLNFDNDTQIQMNIDEGCNGRHPSNLFDRESQQNLELENRLLEITNQPVKHISMTKGTFDTMN